MGHFKSRKPKIDLSRPSVTLGANGKRVWQTIEAQKLQPGDVLAGRGMLHECTYVGGYVHAVVGEDSVVVFFPDDKVFAFAMKGD